MLLPEELITAAEDSLHAAASTRPPSVARPRRSMVAFSCQKGGKKERKRVPFSFFCFFFAEE
jgi:hypothetical protein